MSPGAPGLWARVLVRALVVAAAGVMALGFFGPGAAVLVAGLATLTYVLLWLRGHTLTRAARQPASTPYRGLDPGGAVDAADGGTERDG
ncbi:hypothetical protein KIK06_26000 [Nocardiopsis sp. EMB25]|uniref:hypothetical protein n=1 Tax=Nocardiopsis TaxID=2013 RepID=UPI00034D097A|nr:MULTISPECIES: hypothetical protein [Nocardiopsis]MCY9787337.1 hypothetical protein [Nocardiopsis sp. EMB25]